MCLILGGKDTEHVMEKWESREKGILVCECGKRFQVIDCQIIPITEENAMQVEKCRDHKKIFEAELLELIWNFEDITGTVMEDIEIEHGVSGKGNRMTDSVFARVEL